MKQVRERPVVIRSAGGLDSVPVSASQRTSAPADVSVVRSSWDNTADTKSLNTPTLVVIVFVVAAAAFVGVVLGLAIFVPKIRRKGRKTYYEVEDDCPEDNLNDNNEHSKQITPDLVQKPAAPAVEPLAQEPKPPTLVAPQPRTPPPVTRVVVGGKPVAFVTSGKVSDGAARMDVIWEGDDQTAPSDWGTDWGKVDSDDESTGGNKLGLHPSAGIATPSLGHESADNLFEEDSFSFYRAEKPDDNTKWAPYGSVRSVLRNTPNGNPEAFVVTTRLHQV